MKKIEQWWMIGVLGLSCLIIFQNVSYGQRYLYLEKKFVKRKHKFEPGQSITLQISQDSIWRTYMITGLDFDNNLLRLEGQVVALDSILAIKSPKTILPPSIGKALVRSGLSMGGITVLSELMFKPPNTKLFLITSAATILSGFTLQKIGKIRKTYPLGEKYNLRMVDTDFYIIKEK